MQIKLNKITEDKLVEIETENIIKKYLESNNINDIVKISNVVVFSEYTF